ncbi:UDP-N-acetylmuramate dehydrogenase [Candidatus Profftia tarda]|nr:UDP-N-acetylmuramate dehydrogenase [Candidatus Profftia tarda]
MSTKLKSLDRLTTFRIHAKAKNIITVTSSNTLAKEWRQAVDRKEPVVILGEGSNVLFLEDFNGTIILNRIKGISVTEDSSTWKLHVGAGEKWHELVQYSLANGMSGLENLALIFGCVGSAPIQNIGAYGIEFARVCEYVDVLNLHKNEQFRLTADQCQFGYRESIFTHDYRHGYAVVSVGICLDKHWQPVLEYGDLKKLSLHNVTPKQVFDSVCHMRTTNLPNPWHHGNAGSFFKNPIVKTVLASQIKEKYPEVPMYLQVSGDVKLAAAWLIERCELKGFQIGGAAVDKTHALVLINIDHATSSDVVKLARNVRTCVARKFGIWLEPEVRFISSVSEVNFIEVLE